MWQIATVLRERNSLVRLFNNKRFATTSTSTIAKGFRHYHGSTKSSNARVALQLDYYMSSQFAGVANALVHDLYVQAGLDVTILPTCPPGWEQARVRQHQTDHPMDVAVGVTEQNVFVPTLLANPDLKTTAVAAMFRRSPLAVASLKGGTDNIETIGAHEDTVDLLQRLFPRAQVHASPRGSKVTDLLRGNYDAIQVYTTTEVPTLQQVVPPDHEIYVTPLEGYKNARLGYSQVLFAAEECLDPGNDQREILQTFLRATFEGWVMAIQNSNNPKTTLEAIQEAQQQLQLDLENNDHWHPEVEEDMLLQINDHVKQTFLGDRYGVISSKRWNAACQWMVPNTPPSAGKSMESNFGLDTSVWQPSSQLLAGNELGHEIMEEAKSSAHWFEQTYQRKPSLVVITVGDLQQHRYQHAPRRLQLYSNTSQSWFSKTETGRPNGFDVKEINLDAATTTTEALLQELQKAVADKNCDGIQLMWPLPDHIDTGRVYNAIPISKDVDGIHYIGQQEIGNHAAYPPVTPAATLDLLQAFKIPLTGKRALVIGRSPIAGSPIAHMLREQGAVVTVAHSDTPREVLKELIGTSQVIVTCVGEPGLIPASWMDPAQKTVVVNVGTTFDPSQDRLCSDVEGSIEEYAALYSPVPGGIGPLSSPCLLRNTVKAAWDQKQTAAATASTTWNHTPSTLTKTFHFDNYTAAVEYIQKLDEYSTIMDHHANVTIRHECADGVNVSLEYFTYEVGTITEKDYGAAKVADFLYTGDDSNTGSICMEDFSYHLEAESIAAYPANPRGSTKLLRVDEQGRVTYHPHFEQAIVSLLEGKHVVFNESRVLDGRLFVKNGAGTRKEEEPVELMILDLGNVDLQGSCKETTLRAMLRLKDVQPGDTFTLTTGDVEVTVAQVEGYVGI